LRFLVPYLRIVRRAQRAVPAANHTECRGLAAYFAGPERLMRGAVDRSNYVRGRSADGEPESAKFRFCLTQISVQAKRYKLFDEMSYQVKPAVRDLRGTGRARNTILFEQLAALTAFFLFGPCWGIHMPVGTWNSKALTPPRASAGRSIVL
jgi:hypothetical protein